MGGVKRRAEVAELTGAVLAEEARRRADQQARDADAVLPDDLLPGVGDAPMTFREGLRAGGAAMVAVLFVLNVIDEIPRAVRVLAPDIQATLGISDTVLIGVLGFAGVMVVLGAVPMAALADRVARVRIIPVASAFWAATVFLSGLAVNPFQLFLTNAGTGLGQAYRLPVSNSLLVDAYPIAARSRIFAFEAMGRPVGQLLGPLIVGGTAAWAGGAEGWRAAFFVVAIPPLLAAAASLILKEPERGRFEQEAVFGPRRPHRGARPEAASETGGGVRPEAASETGGVRPEAASGAGGALSEAVSESRPEAQPEPAPEATQDAQPELPVTVGAAFARLRKIKTFYYLATGVGVLGFALIALPIQFNLLLEDKYGLGPLERGIVESLMWVISLAALPFAGRVFDRGFRRDPAAMMRLAGLMVVLTGVVYAAALPIKMIGPLVGLLALGQALISTAFVAAPSIVAAVSPYRIRAQAFALIPVFVFLMGGFFGGLIVGQLSDAYNHRTALLVSAPPAALIGGALIVYGSRWIRRDISLAVEELLEERAEHERMARTAAAGASAPVLQVHNLDFSYGPVQVLFDVSLEVARGETLALLGTNGAGKSTLLRAVSGLGFPDRGVVRLNGRTVTYAEAEARYAAGIVQLRGGGGVFPALTGRDNLRAALSRRTRGPSPSLDRGPSQGPDRGMSRARGLALDRAGRAEAEARADSAAELFPALADRLDVPAGDLSGGQQQMLALAMALAQEPEVLLIDELSLGLAPALVQELLEVVEGLRARGQTMVIVEQSLNVALAFADRAVFMEKGRVRFEGPAAELAERDDLVRAVFLGGEGG